MDWTMNSVKKPNDLQKKLGGASPMEAQERIQDFTDAIQHLAEVVDELNAALDEAEDE